MAEIEVIVESLWELDEDQLAAQIGDRAQAIGMMRLDWEPEG
jgi:hypothetical protein